MTQFLLNHCLLKPVNECLKDEDSNKNNYDKISGSFVKNKANNRQIFLQVLQSVQFFCCQDLAFRSKNGDGKRSSHWRCSIKKVFLETSQNSLEDTCATAFCLMLCKTCKNICRLFALFFPKQPEILSYTFLMESSCFNNWSKSPWYSDTQISHGTSWV